MSISSPMLDDSDGAKMTWESPEFQAVALEVKRVLSCEKSDDKLDSLTMWVNDNNGCLIIEKLKMEDDKSANGQTNLGYHFDYSCLHGSLSERLKGALGDMTLDEFLDVMRTAPLPSGLQVEQLRGQEVMLPNVRKWVYQVFDGAKGLSQEKPDKKTGKFFWGSETVDYYEKIGNAFFGGENEVREAIGERAMTASRVMTIENLRQIIASVAKELDIDSEKFGRYIREARAIRKHE